MAQLTLYLDDETAQKMRRAAEDEGISLSRWVAELIRQRTASRWPESVARLAGAWADFPQAEELRGAEKVPDAPREPL